MAVDAPALAVTAHVARMSAADMREACDKALPHIASLPLRSSGLHTRTDL